MTRRRRGLLVVLVALATLLGAVIAARLSIGDPAEAADTSTTTSTTAAATTTTTTEAPANKGGGDACDVRALLTEYMMSLGYAESEFELDESRFDLTLQGVNDAGNGSLNPEGAASVAEHLEWFGSSDPAAQAARQKWRNALPVGEWHHLMSPERWVAVQILVPSKAHGNTYWDGDNVIPTGTVRDMKAGEIWFFFILSDCTVFADLSQRGPCENPQTEPPAPEKDPALGILQNPELPRQVSGPGTTPPGGDPGPADPSEAHNPDNPDCANDGYCEGTAPPEEATPSTTSTTLPPEVSDPEPDPGDQSGDEPLESGEPTECDPSICDG